MSFIINLVRNVLGGIIAFFDIITRGSKLTRNKEAQQRIEQELVNLSLYQFFACPFCIKTRRALYKLNLPIKKFNVSKGSPYRDELLRGGGKIQTPCLKIEQNGEIQWLYDSSAIIDYMQKRFS